MKNLTMFIACALALSICTTSAFAQGPRVDTLKQDYFSNANTAGAPDAKLRLSNPGTYPGGNICASIFVFDPYQELSECCSCLLSPDGLRTLSIDNDVTGNPLTGVTLTTGKIAIVSNPPISGSCPLPTSLSPTPGIRSWAGHVQNAGFAITETPSQSATLSYAEDMTLGEECFAVELVGSEKGVCSCGTGD